MIFFKKKDIYCRFVKTNYFMFEFDQYLGFLAFLSILTMGFWLMIFLLTFVIPYWLFGSTIEAFNEWRKSKQINK